MLYNKIGDIHRSNRVDYELVRYIRDMQVLSNLPERVFGLLNERTIRFNHNHFWEGEVWLAQRVNGDVQIIMYIQKPSVSYSEDSLLRDRPKGQYINDSQEVNLLTDSYEEYINGTRNLLYKDPILLKKRQKLADLVLFFKSQYQNSRSPLRIGFKLLYVHRVSPSIGGISIIKKYKQNNPKHWNRIQEIIAGYVKSQKTGSSAESI